MNTINTFLKNELKSIKEKGLFKDERLIYSQQNSEIIIHDNLMPII